MRFSAAHNRAKATIKACVESGAGIEFLTDAPTFRYTPPANRPLHSGPPSKRSVGFPLKPHMKDIRNWQPARLVCGPEDYRLPMRGDDAELTEAREQWADGNPYLLRELLAERKLAA